MKIKKSYLVFNENNDLVGVFNLNEIVRGYFQNAYLGFYGVINFSNQGYMSAGLKLVVNKVFNDLKLHRIEANIQPSNEKSIFLVKSNRFRYEGFSPRYLKINNEWCGHERWAMTYEDYICESDECKQKDLIELVPYNSNWPLQAKAEIIRLQQSDLGIFIFELEHVGSTAIPGLSAKPIIDLQIAVSSLKEAKIYAVPIMQKLGYEYWHDNPDTERMFFVKGMPPYGEKRTYHVHIVEKNSHHWHNKLLFKNYLLQHPETILEYETLKKDLAIQFANQRELYTEGKKRFIDKILSLSK